MVLVRFIETATVPFVEREAAIGQVGQRHVVGDEEHRELGDEHLVDDTGGVVAVELGDDLVGQQQRWLVGHRHGESHPLGLTAGEVAGTMVGPVGHAEPLQQFERPDPGRAVVRRAPRTPAPARRSLAALRNGMRLSDCRAMPISSGPDPGARAARRDR